MFKKVCKFIGLGIIIYLIMALLVSRGTFLGIQKSLQNKFYDFASASSEIVVVAIDEKSLLPEELGPLQQWPRANYAKAIELLNQERAAVIGIDMTFPDKKGDDTVFRDTLKTHKNVVLSARYYFQNGNRLAEWPNSTLLEAESRIGWININLDEDGFVRKVPLFTAFEDKMQEAFSLQVAREYLRADPVDYSIRNDQFKFSERITIPTITLRDPRNHQEHHFMYINYFAEPGSYTQISMTDVLKENFVDQQGNRIDFMDKIVLIGPTAMDLQDYYLSPVSAGVQMPGVEIHANNVQTLITEKFLRDQSRLSLWLTLLGLLLINLFLFAKLRVRYAIPVFILELFGIIVAGIVAYEYRIFLNVIYPILIVILTFIGTFLLRFILEQSERKFIEGAFGHYVNKEVVEQILKDPKMMELGGAKREVTAFFSDISGFTTISEKMKPNELVQFLNGYLNEMTNIILDHKGTLDKYEGDAIMAFWGAPLPLREHAKNTCLAALQNQKRLKELRKEWERQGLPPIHVRIGINSGEVIAGNMGSENRFDYTIMGDNVNLASRLEGINKQYGTETIISEYTYKQVKDDFICRELDQIRVKGKEEPVRIYELIGKKGEVKAGTQKPIKAFEEALKLYREKNFTEAQKKFKAIKDDPPSEVFAERCEEFSKNPPPEDWDGVYTFTTK